MLYTAVLHVVTYCTIISQALIQGSVILVYIICSCKYVVANLNELVLKFIYTGNEPSRVALQEQLNYEHQRIGKGWLINCLYFKSVVKKSNMFPKSNN